MKGKILALLFSLILSGTAGLYAKNTASPQTSQAAESTAVTAEAASAETSGCAVSSADGQSVCGTSNQTVSAKTQSSASSKSCSSNSSCKANSSCAARNSCSQNICFPNSNQSSCAADSSCRNNSIDLNQIMSRLAGNTCSRTSSGSTSSKASSSAAAAKSQSGSASSSSPVSAASGTYAEFQNQVVQLVNQERTSRGLKALSVDSALTQTATLKSQDMAKLGYFDHTSPTYGSPFDMMKQFGISYRTAGENIAMGQTSPQQVMSAWMNSEGHRANILNSSFTKIGVGIARNSSGQYYWTQQFIG